MVKINKKQERMRINKILLVLVSVIFLVGVLSAYQYYYPLTSPQNFGLFNTKFVGNTLQLDINKSSSPYDSLVGYWSFDADNSTTAFDLSGNGNNGVYYGNAISADNGSGYGKSGVFDGNGDYVQINYSQSLSALNFSNPYSAFSVCAWVNFNYSGSNYILEGSGQNFRFGYNPSVSDLYFPSASCYNLNIPIVQNQWNYVCANYNFSTGTRFYINGSYVGSNQSACTTTFYGNNFAIGGFAGTTRQMNGSIDEFMIFNKSLTADEVSAIYNNQSQRFNQEGMVSLKQVAINETYDLINISLNQSSLFGSNVSASLGYWNTSYEYKNYNESGYVDFDGNGDYINIVNNPSINFDNNSFSVVAWIKVSPGYHAPVIGAIVMKSYPNSAPYQGFNMYIDNNGKLIWGIQDNLSNGRSLTLLPSTYNFSDGNWHLVVGVANRSGNSTLYTDAIGRATGTLSNLNSSINSNNAAGIGIQVGSTRYFNGSMDEVMIFNRSLNSTEISEIYNLNRSYYNGSTEGLVSYYSFDSLTARDDFGNNSGRSYGDTTYLPKHSSSIYNGLINHFTMDGNVNDYSGIGNDGILYTTATVNETGIYGNAINLQGGSSASRIVFSQEGLINATNFTFGAWVYPTNISGATRTLYSQEYYPTGSLWLYITSSGILQAIQWNVSGFYSPVATTTTLPLSQWSYISFVIINNFPRIYVNGVEANYSIQRESLPQPTSNRPTTIGYYHTQPLSNYGYQGLIDDVMIWNRTLSEQEVYEIYSQGLANWQYIDEETFTTDTVSFNATEKIPSGATNLLPRITLTASPYSFYTPIITGIVDLFLLDITNPVVVFNSETIASGTGIQVDFNVSANITESNLDRIIYEWNNTNTTYYTISPEVSLLENGRYSFLYAQSPPSSVEIINLTIYAIDNQGNIGKTETRTIRGNAPPTINSISYYPNNLGDLDPNQMIEVLVSVTDEESNLNSTILQWKNSTQSWSDATNTTVYNTTVENSSSIVGWCNFTPTSEDIFTFRIIANDSVGANSYNNTNVSVFWDCTWNMSSANGYNLGAFFGWSDNVNFVNFTIFNTGDSEYADSCPLIFLVNGPNLPLSPGVRFKIDNSAYTKTYSTLFANQNQTVSLFYRFYNAIYSEPLTISISELSGLASSDSTASLSTTVISTSGPYLYQTVKDVASNSTNLLTKRNESYYEVLLSPQTLIFNSSIRNGVGNGSDSQASYNTTLNWTFDESFVFTNDTDADEIIFTNDSFSFFYNNISDGLYGEEHYSWLQFDLNNSSALSINNAYSFTIESMGFNQTGSQLVMANDTSVNTFGLDISFTCYQITDGICFSQCSLENLGLNSTIYDPDCGYCGDGEVQGWETCTNCVLDVGACPSTNTGGSGGGGGGGGGAGGTFDKSEATFELVRGEANEFYLTLENKLPSTKQDITVKVSGDNSQYFSVPSTIDSIAPNSKKNLTVKITAPSYFPVGQYLIKFEFNGKIVGNTTSQFTETKYVTLRILEISRVKADEFVESSNDFVSKMNESGFLVKDVNDLLKQINDKYNSSDFGAVRDISKSLEDIYNAAVESNETIAALTASIAEAEKNGIQVSETKKLLYLSQILFNRGDYVLALEKLKEANLTYALETKGEFKILYAIKNNPLEALGILISLSVVGTGSSLFARAKYLKRKLRVLGEEEVLLLGLMKVVQRDCFENKKMSMEEYESAMMQYEKRLSEVIQDKIKTETQLTNLMKLKGKKNALDQERDRLQHLIMKTQDDYMNKGKMDTRIYGNMLKTYATRLNQIEEELIFMEAKDELRKVTGIRLLRKNNQSNKTP